MRFFGYLSLAIAGGLGGFFLTRSSESSSEIQALSAPAEALTGRTEARIWQIEDFEALFAQAREEKADGLMANPLHDELSQWSVDELRAALQAAISHPGFYLRDSKLGAVTRHLLNEWMHRDLDGFLFWYDGLKSERARSTMAMTMSFLWPSDRAEDGVRYLLSHPEFKAVNGGSGAWKIVKNALDSAALRGPQATAEFLATIHQNGLGQDASPVAFPPGFDFASLMKTDEAQALWKSGNADNLLGGWMKQDRDGAFDAITAHSAEEAVRSPTLLFSRNIDESAEAYTEKMSWLANRASDLEPDKRDALIKEGLDQIISAPFALKAFTDGLADSADQHLVHSRAVEAIQTIGAEAAFSHLEAMGDPAERIEFLETFTPAEKRFGPPPPPISEDLIRSKLTEWKATPEEIDNIVNRLKAK